jgi:hypothetical protein
MMRLRTACAVLSFLVPTLVISAGSAAARVRAPTAKQARRTVVQALTSRLESGRPEHLPAGQQIGFDGAHGEIHWTRAGASAETARVFRLGQDFGAVAQEARYTEYRGRHVGTATLVGRFEHDRTQQELVVRVRTLEGGIRRLAGHFHEVQGGAGRDAQPDTARAEQVTLDLSYNPASGEVIKRITPEFYETLRLPGGLSNSSLVHRVVHTPPGMWQMRKGASW